MARILIIDDESNIRLMLRLALTADGHKVETAADGVEGLEHFGNGEMHDLVLLDHRMPNMAGLEVLRVIKKRSPATRVIMITAFGTIDLAMAARRAGVANFLRKPFTTETLRRAVTTALTDGPVEEFCEITPSGSAAAHVAAGVEKIAVNGFRLESDATSRSIDGAGNLIHHFTVRTPDGGTSSCKVVLPPFFVELVKAHADRDDLDNDPDFWRWLSEEALANYYWQQAGPPPNCQLTLGELTSNLRRWMDAALS